MSDVKIAPRGNSPAFPCQDAAKQIWTGMNLRDHFALEALNGLIKVVDANVGTPVHLATKAYAIANCMLDEREKFR